MLITARHGSLRTEVYQYLREKILSGNYERGASLTEASIARETGVSRTPIREAICQLELDGLVQTTPNRSVVVRGFDEQDILDLYDVRSLVETLAAGRAAKHMSPELKSELTAAFQKELAATEAGDTESMQKLDSDFHNLVFQGSGSSILQHLLSSIGVYTRQARTVSLTVPGRSRKVLLEHQNIMEAILAEDSDLARERMREHIANAAANFKAVSQNRRLL